MSDLPTKCMRFAIVSNNTELVLTDNIQNPFLLSTTQISCFRYTSTLFRLSQYGSGSPYPHIAKQQRDLNHSHGVCIVGSLSDRPIRHSRFVHANVSF